MTDVIEQFSVCKWSADTSLFVAARFVRAFVKLLRGIEEGQDSGISLALKDKLRGGKARFDDVSLNFVG
jgi:hypothetical protein